MCCFALVTAGLIPDAVEVSYKLNPAVRERERCGFVSVE